MLGQSAAFSGPAEQLGVQNHLGAKLYFDQLNANGGVNGRPIETCAWTTATNPTAARRTPGN